MRAQRLLLPVQGHGSERGRHAQRRHGVSRQAGARHDCRRAPPVDQQPVPLRRRGRRAPRAILHVHTRGLAHVRPLSNVFTDKTPHVHLM